MDQTKIKLFAKKYRKTQNILSLVLTILILIVGLIVLSFGIYFVISIDLDSIIIGVIMILISILDIFMALKFYLTIKRRIKNMKDSEAAIRYTKITGKN